MPDSPLFVFEDTAHEKQARAPLGRMPAMAGKPVIIQAAKGLRDRRGPVHAGAFLRERRIRFDCARREFPRIFVHEVFHFVWLRAGNPMRWAFEDLVRAELGAGARGELGWSAEWRKVELIGEDAQRRTGRWREYCCESFCDTAAWLYSGEGQHEEFTLSKLFRQRRRVWFRKTIETMRLSI